MIDIVLFDDMSTLRVANKALRFFSNMDKITTRDTIWVNGLYVNFKPELISVNPYNSKLFSTEKMIECLLYILDGEEVFLNINQNCNKYFKCIGHDSDIASLLSS